MAFVGLFGGSFNPIHLGHLLAARAAAEAFGLERVLLVPCNVSPFKRGAKDLAPAADRLEMVRLCAAGDPLFEPCGIELERGGVSYAVETVRALRERRPSDRLAFIVGMDALRELNGWHRAAELLTLCEVLTLCRPGAALPASADELGFDEPVRRRLLAHVAQGRLCDISASEIRRRIAEGRSIRYLVTPDVEAYIRSKGLYRA